MDEVTTFAGERFTLREVDEIARKVNGVDEWPTGIALETVLRERANVASVLAAADSVAAEQ